MERPIKFRAWNDVIKQMSEPFTLLELHPWLHPDKIRNYNIRCIEPSLIIMQFTGLHDKDGKEIYEGDILKSEHFRVGKTEYYLYHRVCWDESHTGWVAVSMSNKDCDLMQSGNVQLWVYFRNAVNPIVIGNIYQNPDRIRSGY